MSHSQFHSTNLFILRHAWLNLWDKHMTTGRINQVTTPKSKSKDSQHIRYWVLADCSQMGVRYKASTPLLIPHCNSQSCSPRVLTDCKSTAKHLVPRSHKLQTKSPCSKNRNHSLQWGLPATGTPERRTQLRRIPEWLIATGLAISK